MNRQQIEGSWKQLKGHAREKWGELTDNDLDEIAGRRDVLVGTLQERYGKSKERIENEVEEWLDSLDTERMATH